MISVEQKASNLNKKRCFSIIPPPWFEKKIATVKLIEVGFYFN